MVKIACTGESKVVRSMMESLAELAGKEGEIVISATRCVAKFPVKTLLSDLRAKEGNGRLTLTFHDNTGNIQIHSSAAVEDELKEFLAELESWYVEVCRAGSYMDVKVPEKYQAAISSLRLPAWSSANGVDEDTGDGKFSGRTSKSRSSRQSEKVSVAPDLIPKTPEYQSGLVRIALQVCAEFRTFPCSRDALLEDMKNHYGLSFEVLKEALGREGETAFVNIETVGTETA